MNECTVKNDDLDPSTILDVLIQLSGDDNASVEDGEDGHVCTWEGEYDEVLDQIGDELETYCHTPVGVE